MTNKYKPPSSLVPGHASPHPLTAPTPVIVLVLFLSSPIPFKIATKVRISSLTCQTMSSLQTADSQSDTLWSISRDRLCTWRPSHGGSRPVPVWCPGGEQSTVTTQRTPGISGQLSQTSVCTDTGYADPDRHALRVFNSHCHVSSLLSFVCGVCRFLKDLTMSNP